MFDEMIQEERERRDRILAMSDTEIARVIRHLANPRMRVHSDEPLDEYLAEGIARLLERGSNLNGPPL